MCWRHRAETTIQVPFAPRVWRNGSYYIVTLPNGKTNVGRVIAVEHDLHGPPITTLYIRDLYFWERWLFHWGRRWRRTVRRLRWRP